MLTLLTGPSRCVKALLRTQPSDAMPSDAMPTGALLSNPRLRRLLIVGVFVVVGLLGVGAPASGHDSAVGTTPEDGAQLTVAPTSVSVELSDVPQSIAPRIVVTDENGAAVFDGEPVIDGRTATAQLPALENGVFQVAWRVVSSDGHPIEGTYSSTVNYPAAVAPSPAATADPSAQTTTPDGATTDDAAAGDAATGGAASDSRSPSDASTSAADDSSGSSTAWLSGAGIVILIVIAILALVVLLRRRTSLRDES